MKFHVGRVVVEISYPFAAMLALLLVLDTKKIAVAGLLATFIHEMGHFLWMYFSKTSIRSVCFTISGIQMKTRTKKVAGYGSEACLALAGPSLNLFAAGICTIFLRTPFGEKLVLTNLVMMAVNILPIQSLDGGSALEALLCLKLSREQAEKISFIVSVLCLIPLTLLGFLIVFQSQYNFTLLILALFLVYNIAVYSKENHILVKDR